ncbi:hypothetical protein [Pseudoduganella violaceinigra]|uniref:hypothetical protein n=1 Tax=Pseudoduganella violaceinigra TaxID=246602 RepID=UPI0012B572D0|nr:hypothetical protein [Pseudoduganella violaceinigra]
MKKSAIFAALLLSACAAQAQQSYEPKEVPGLENQPAEKLAPAQAPAQEPAPEAELDAPKAGANEFCLFKGKPPTSVKYKELGHVKYGKGTYGSAAQIVPEVVSQATSRGANAIADFSGAQHFGFWPWRLVRPVVQGTAIKLDGSKNCRAIGGTPLSEVLSSGQGPAN